MKQELHFYINSQEVEFNEAPDILYSYKVTDLTNPTVVYNSFSKTITIPGTPNNNQLFGGIWNLNRTQLYGGEGTVYFDPSKKASFIIYLNGEIYESGYAKLTNVVRENNNITYEIELFGGLGSMLYNLSYKAGTNGDDGDAGKLKLSDLYYRFDNSAVNETNEFNFIINKDAIFQAWTKIGPWSSGYWLWSYINFMPSYNGYPDNFSSDKALINWYNMPQGEGMVNTVTKDGKTYISHNGYSLATLPDKITEWEAKDLRSYLQRPVLRVKGLFEAIQHYVAKEENGGYDLRFDSDFFNNRNMYYTEAWITLPLLTDYENQGQTETSEITLRYTGTTYEGSISDVENGYTSIQYYKVSGLTDNDIINTCNLACNFGCEIGAGSEYKFYIDYRYGAHPVRYIKGSSAIYCQLVAYDENDNILGGSPINVICESEEYARNFNYTPRIHNSNYNYITSSSFVNESSNIFKLNKEVVFSITSNAAIDHYRLFITQFGKRRGVNSTGYYEVNDNSQIFTSSSVGNMSNFRTLTASTSISVSNNGKIRSNCLVTKQILLDTEYTPAEYLLGYCKQFGLYFYKEPDSNIVHILDRNSFYKRNEVVNLEDYIDKSKEMTITPVAFENKYYDFNLAAKGGEFETQYENTNSLPYGLKRVNTGYNFNRESKDLFKDNCYHGALECLEKSKYNFENPNGKGPFLFDGTKYELYYNSLSESTEQEINIKDWTNTGQINEDLKYYDVFPKIQFHDADQKPFDGSNCLVFYLGTNWDWEGIDNGFYWVSDDVPEMGILNKDEYCWLVSNTGLTVVESGFSRTFARSLYGQRIAEKYTYLPHFGRNYKNFQSGWILRSWDFGTPRTTFMPNTIYRENSTLYSEYWKDYISDMYNINTRVLTCYVRLTERPNPDWLRRFYWFDNAIWRLNAIYDWNITSFDTTKMEFIKVQDRNNYKNEVIETAYTAYITSTASTISESGATIQVKVTVGDGGYWSLTYDEDKVVPQVSSGMGDMTFNVTILPNTGASRDIYIYAEADVGTTLTLHQNGNVPNHRVWLSFDSSSNPQMYLNIENCVEDMEITINFDYHGYYGEEETFTVPVYWEGYDAAVELSNTFNIQSIEDAMEAINYIRFEDTGGETSTMYNGNWYYFDRALTHNNCDEELESAAKEYILDNTDWGEPYSE